MIIKGELFGNVADIYSGVRVDDFEKIFL